VPNNTYRGYFLVGSRIVDVMVIECPDDPAALAEAKEILSTSRYASMEIWLGTRRVSTITRAAHG
jgi:hypothetical protein